MPVAAIKLAARARNRSTDRSAGIGCTEAAPVSSLKCSSSRAISNRRGWPASKSTTTSDEEPSANERDVDESMSAAATAHAVRENRSLRKKNNINLRQSRRTCLERKSKPGEAKVPHRLRLTRRSFGVDAASPRFLCYRVVAFLVPPMLQRCFSVRTNILPPATAGVEWHSSFSG